MGGRKGSTGCFLKCGHDDRGDCSINREGGGHEQLEDDPWKSRNGQETLFCRRDHTI